MQRLQKYLANTLNFGPPPEWVKCKRSSHCSYLKPPTLLLVTSVCFFSYLENCSIFGRKFQVTDLFKGVAGFYSEWRDPFLWPSFYLMSPDLFIFDPTIFIVSKVFFQVTRLRNHFPLTFLQRYIWPNFYSEWPNFLNCESVFFKLSVFFNDRSSFGPQLRKSGHSK